MSQPWDAVGPEWPDAAMALALCVELRTWYPDFWLIAAERTWRRRLSGRLIYRWMSKAKATDIVARVE